MRKSILIIFLIFSFWLIIAAQEDSKTSNLKSGIELGSGFSYTGLNVNLAYTLAWGNNTAFLGPKITVSDSYIPTKGPWGIHAGYRRLLPGQSKFRSFASFDYQVVFLEPYNPNDLDVKGKNETHELFLSYGIQYQVWKNLILGNSIGTGAYIERFIDTVTGDKKNYNGFNGQFRFFAQYSF